MRATVLQRFAGVYAVVPTSAPAGSSLASAPLERHGLERPGGSSSLLLPEPLWPCVKDKQTMRPILVCETTGGTRPALSKVVSEAIVPSQEDGQPKVETCLATSIPYAEGCLAEHDSIGLVLIDGRPGQTMDVAAALDRLELKNRQGFVFIVVETDSERAKLQAALGRSPPPSKTAVLEQLQKMGTAGMLPPTETVAAGVVPGSAAEVELTSDPDFESTGLADGDREPDPHLVYPDVITLDMVPPLVQRMCANEPPFAPVADPAICSGVPASAAIVSAEFMRFADELNHQHLQYNRILAQVAEAYGRLDADEQHAVLQRVYDQLSQRYGYMDEHLDALAEIAANRLILDRLVFPICDPTCGPGEAMMRVLKAQEKYNPDYFAQVKVSRRGHLVYINDFADGMYGRSRTLFADYPGVHVSRHSCFDLCEKWRRHWDPKMHLDEPGFQPLIRTMFTAQTFNLLSPKDKRALVEVGATLLRPGGYWVVVEDESWHHSTTPPDLPGLAIRAAAHIYHLRNAEPDLDNLMREHGLVSTGYLVRVPINLPHDPHKLVALVYRKPPILSPDGSEVVQTD